MKARNIVMQIGGMSCSGCSAGIEGTLKNHGLIESATIDATTGRAEFHVNSGVTIYQLAELIEEKEDFAIGAVTAHQLDCH